ncbi:MAG: DUF2807 domain-containing protein [Sinomicrobium sp.]|nr:DUF2807 domain-containing protein [Sinomicrobium sp.]
MKTGTPIATLCISIFLIAISANAQWRGSNEKVKGNGSMVTKERKTADYDAISVAGSFDVELVAGTEGNIVINAEENLIPHIETEVKNNTLKIGVEEGYSLHPGRNHKMLITVPFKDISKVSLAGSGDVMSKNPIKADSFTASIAGSGDMDLEVNASQVKGSVAGSGDLRLKGSTTDFECSIAGSGDVYAFDLMAENVEASVSGSGDARVYCNGALKARVVGSGDITYKGNPKKEDTKAMGSGDISKG